MDNIDDTDSSDNASPLKQKLLKRNSLFGDELLNFDAVDLEDDDWQDVFDDQDEASAGDDSSAAAGSPNTISSSNSDSDHPLTDTTAPSSLTGGALSTASNKDSHAPNGVHGSSRESLDASNVAPEVSTVDTSEQAKNGGLPLTSRDWQNPMEDKPHREKMIQDM